MRGDIHFHLVDHTDEVRKLALLPASEAVTPAEARKDTPSADSILQSSASKTPVTAGGKGKGKRDK